MPVRVVWPWEGSAGCGQPRCRNREIDGLGWCFRHVPGDLLDEAEEITGLRRCRVRGAGPEACHQVARKGSDPPRCGNHGGPASTADAKAARNVVEGSVLDRMAAIMAEHGDRLLDPPPVENPLTELLGLAAEMREWKVILQQIVAYLFSRQRIRSSHDKVGEQLRAEVLLYERAIERLAKIYQDIVRLGIESRLAAIEESQARMVEQALAAALNASGLDLVGQESARQALRRELVKAARAS